MPQMGETVVKNLPRSTVEHFKKINRMKEAAAEMLTNATEQGEEMWKSLGEEYDLQLDLGVYKVDAENRCVVYIRRKFSLEEE